MAAEYAGEQAPLAGRSLRGEGWTATVFVIDLYPIRSIVNRSISSLPTFPTTMSYDTLPPVHDVLLEVNYPRRSLGHFRACQLPKHISCLILASVSQNRMTKTEKPVKMSSFIHISDAFIHQSKCINTMNIRFDQFNPLFLASVIFP